MIWLDRFCLKLAKILIAVAGFFGISRWRLINVWVIVTGFIFYLQVAPRDIWLNCVIALPLTILVYVVMWWSMIKRMYREDDVIADDYLLTSRAWRIGLMLVWMVMGYSNCIPTHQSINWTIVILKLSSTFYFPYFILNQNTRSKVTLRGLVKSAASRLAEVLQPRPQTAPQPVPVRAASSIRLQGETQ